MTLRASHPPGLSGAILCTICGYAGLATPPYADDAVPSFTLCPCCGTEFGFDDDPAACGVDPAPDFGGPHTPIDRAYRVAAHHGLRRRWVDAGMTWWSAGSRPAHWDPLAQVQAIDRTVVRKP